MNYALLLSCANTTAALQVSALGNVDPELAALIEELKALVAPVVEEAPAEEAPVVEEAPAEEAPANE